MAATHKHMAATHQVTPAEIGMLRIYMKRADKAGPRTARSLWGAKPLYRELVVQAKAEGLMNAIAHPTQYGYSNHGPVREDGVETLDPQLTMCVEMIGPRDHLERFCQRHGGLLAGKMIVYKHLEHWSIGPAGVAHQDASPQELAAG
jgi:PII-like signaling protein